MPPLASLTRHSVSLRRTLVAMAVAAGAMLLPLAAYADTLKIGVPSSASNDALRHAAGLAAKQGLDVKIVEFTDWTTPNTALASKDIDANYFEHIPFLKEVERANGWDFVAVAPGFVAWEGVYSDKIKSLDQLRSGATVAIANDPVNTGRALLFLQSLKLLQLKPGADVTATVNDILENPKKLKIVQLEAQQVVRALPDVDIGITFPSFIKLAGMNPDSGIAFEEPSDTYAIWFVARQDDAKSPLLAKFIQIYHDDPELKPMLTRLYGGKISFAW